MKKTIFLITAAVIITASCATMKNGPDQQVRIETPGKSGASCELSNLRGKWQVKSTPAHLTVARAASPLKIVCQKGNWNGAAEIKSKFQKHAVLGGMSGMTVDVATGSAYSYPERIQVK